MKSWKKFASSLFAIILGASLMATPAAAAFADEASDASAAADSISQVPDLTGSTSEGTDDATSTTDVNATVLNEIGNGQYVIDEDNLLSSSDIDRLNAMAASVAQSQKVAPYYFTTSSLGGYASASDYAEALNNSYTLENRADKGCIIFLVCLNEGKYALSSFGDAADVFNESMLDYLDKDLFPYLGRSDWAGAAETFFGDVEQTMKGGKANATSSVPYNGTYVTDDYNLLSDEQRATLEAKATQLAEQYNMGVYLLIVDNMGSQNPTAAQRTNFATSFYRAYDLGLGSGRDGIMFVLAAGSRDYVTIAYGQGSYSFSDEGIAAMEDAVTEELSDNNWYDGCKNYYDKIGEQLEYYSVKGEPWTEPDYLTFILKVLATLGIPAGVAFGSVNRQKEAMHTAREQTEASNYLVPRSFEMLHSTDDFINTTMVVTPLPKHDDDDSGGGSSFGGGGWGGGGGGGFSSSGGGKF